MPTLLKNLKLDELSLVTRGANQYAKAPIFKADTSEGDNMADTIEKMTDEQQAELDKMSDDKKKKMQGYMKEGMSYDKAKAMCAEDAKKSLEEENQKLRKALLDNGFKITKEGVEKSEPVEYIEVGGEQINKADVPAAILKQLEEAQIEKQEAAIAKQAEEKLPNFKKEVAVELLKFDLSEDVLAALMAMDKLFEGQMEEIGKSTDADGDMTDPNEKMNALAKAHAEEKQVSFAKAYEAVSKTDAGKALLKAIYKKD